MEEVIHMPENLKENDTLFKNLNSFIGSEEFSKVISQPVNKTTGEVLMMLLKYAITYSLSQTAVTNLFFMINYLFSSPILPTSCYLIEGLFNPSGNATFHGVCPECGTYIRTFTKSSKTTKCNFWNIDISTDSSYNDFFVNFDVNPKISELVKMNSDYYYDIMNHRVHEKGVFKDVYDGNMYQEFSTTLDERERHQYLTGIFNTDGAPLFKSSAYSIWPIYLQLNELPIQVRRTELIVFGLWFGKNKPEMNTFLEPFVQKMNKLSTEGVQCEMN